MARWRSRRLAVAALAAALGAAGCGSQFELPTESARTAIPGENSYGIKFRWAGFAGATDVLLTDGGRVWVAEPRPGAPDSARVREYLALTPDPTPGVEVADLNRPVHLAEGPTGELFVLDEGSPPTVKRYTKSGTASRGSFRDAAWVEAVDDTSRPNSRTIRVTNSRVALRGLAVDAAGDVYVSWVDSAFHFDRDLIDTSRTSSSFDVRDVIRKYSVDGIVLLDVATRGTGTGFVDGPGGLVADGGALLFADVNKDWVQKVDANAPSRPIQVYDGLQIADSLDPGFAAPFDVDVDDSGFVYIADTGKGRVLKLEADGTLDRRVDVFDPDADGPTETAEPIAVSANTELAFVLDRQLGMVLVYQLRASLDTGKRP
jgi:hypothetical protein